MKKKTWIIGVLVFGAAIVVSLAVFGARVIWDIFQVLEHGF